VVVLDVFGFLRMVFPSALCVCLCDFVIVHINCTINSKIKTKSLNNDVTLRKLGSVIPIDQIATH